MAILDHQLVVGAESAYGTLATLSRAFEYDSESINDSYGRTEGDPLRVGSAFQRNDRFTPYYEGASGNISFAVMTKGFGFWLPHMLGQVATTGPAETTAYTHTGTEGPLFGKSFSAQVNRPFHPSGTNQPFTFRGGKVTEWTLSNDVDANLMCELGVDFMQVDTATALATATYPTLMDNFTWAGGKVTIAGTDFDVTEISIAGSNGQDVDRRQIRQNTDKKEPTSARREGTFSIGADFDSLTHRARAASTSRAGALAQVVASWRGPNLLGSTLYPELTITLPACRFDEWEGASEGPEGIEQSLSGVYRYAGTGSPITIAYRSADTVA